MAVDERGESPGGGACVLDSRVCALAEDLRPIDRILLRNPRLAGSAAAHRISRMSTTRRAYIAWAIVCVVWGTTYLAIRVALESIPPMLMAAMRWIAAGSLLMLGLKIRGERLPGPRTWPALTALGVLLLGFGN